MSKIHFIGGEKGGVGKSMTSRLLAQYYIDQNSPFCGFDSDSSHGTFSRFYGEFTSPLTMSDFASLDELVEAVENHPEQDIIVDLAAQTRTELLEWIEESDAIELFNELGCKPYLWHVMDDGADSLNLLDTLIQAFADANIQLVVVENFGRGEDFEHLHQSPVLDKAKSIGVHIISLKKLQPSLTRKIDYNNLSFWAAANDSKVMSIAERKRVKVWLQNAYNQFDRCLAPKQEMELHTAW